MEESENRLTLMESSNAMDLINRPEAPYSWIVFGLLALLSAVVLFTFVRKKSKPEDPTFARKQAYQAALQDFQRVIFPDLQNSAIQISITLRRYLAVSLDQPALYETHEEFISKNVTIPGIPDDLREKFEVFFNRLALIKYHPNEDVKTSTNELFTEGKDLLERIHKL